MRTLPLLRFLSMPRPIRPSPSTSASDFVSLPVRRERYSFLWRPPRRSFLRNTLADQTRRKATAHIEVIPAKPKDEPILANLLELYAHDFSEFHNIDLGADGRFGYK